MKRSTKISIILVILGAILMGLGWWHHGNKGVIWSSDLRRFHVVQRAKTSFQPQKYQRIVVDSQAPVTIKAGKTNRVTLSYLDDAKGRPHATVKQGTLTITGKNSHLSDSYFGFNNSDTYGGVLVTVPQNKTLSEIVVEKQSGSISLRTLRAKKMTIANSEDVNLMDLTVQGDLTVKSSGGNILADEIKANRLQLTANNGDVGVSSGKLAATTNQFRSDNGNVWLTETRLGGGRIISGNGDIRLQDNQLTKRLTATTDDGNITAHIGKNSGAKVSTTGGNISVRGHARHSGYWLNKQAKTQYQLNAENGDVTVSSK